MSPVMKNRCYYTHFIVTLITTLSFSPLSWSGLTENLGLEKTEPEKKQNYIERKIKNKIADLDINIGAKLFDVDVLDGLSLSMKYRYGLEPSYSANGLYTRTDKYILKLNIEPGDIIQAIGDDGIIDNMPIGISLNKNAEILFARQFDSQFSGATALPYTPWHLPLSANRALSRLKVGDFVSFKTSLNLVVHAELLNKMFNLVSSSTASSVVSLFASAYYIVSGDFQVQVYRMADNKIRLRLIADRKKTKDLRLGVELNTNLSIVGINIVDDILDKVAKKIIVKSTIAELNFFKTHADLFMLDYALNLSDPAVAKAYDAVMASGVKLNLATIRVANPLISTDKLEERLLTDATALEDLYEKNRNLEVKNRPVHRYFKGRDLIDTRGRDLKLGINLIRFEGGSTYTEHDLAMVDANQITTYYRFNSHYESKTSKFLFGIFKTNVVRRMTALFLQEKVNDEIVPKKFEELAMSTTIKDKKFSNSEFNAVRTHLQQLLPPAEYNKIQWGNWSQEKPEEINNVYIDFQLVFNSSALDVISSSIKSEQDLQERVDQYLLTLKDVHTLPRKNLNSEYTRKSDGREITIIDRFRTERNHIINTLGIVFDPSINAIKRIDAAMSLRKSAFFKEIGSGLLISLLPKENPENFVRFSLLAEGEGMDKVLVADNTVRSEIYRVVRQIENTINNRAVDLRIEGLEPEE